MRGGEELVSALIESIGEAVYEDTTGFANPPDPRVSWIDLQHDVVAAEASLTPDERRRVAAALLRAILEQPSYGPANQLDVAAFDLLLRVLGDDLALALGTTEGHPYGGRRYLRERLWHVPGDEGARWLGRLAAADDVGTNFLFQDMHAGKTARWPDADWPGRLDAIADLPPDPAPGITRVLFLADAPRAASPAFVRIALAHAENERDGLVRSLVAHLERHRGPHPDDDIDLLEWADRERRPELFRWILELMGPDGYRRALVEVAAARGLLPADDAEFLAAPLARPAWADGEVPWSVDSVERIGVVALPTQRLAGGDPWWAGGAEPLPWIVALDVAAVEVDVVVASHPLAGRQCAALVAHAGAGPVESWRLVVTDVGADGYTVETGVGSFGAVESFESGAIHDLREDLHRRPPPMWHLLDTGGSGAIAMSSVGPQHQRCRTWIATGANGRVVMLVTDLGLLDLDLERDPVLPWTATG